MKTCYALLAVIVLTLTCHARTITVDDDGPADFNNIQAAINDANEADTVVVKPGHYNEMITIDINMVLTSENPEDPCIVASTIIDACGLGSAITLSGTESPNCIITGLTVTGAGDGDVAGIAGNWSLATIRNCIIRDNGESRGGLWLCDGLISNCEIRNQTDGLNLCNGEIRNCLVVGNFWGIYDAKNVNNSTISGAFFAIASTHGNHSDVSNCIVWGNVIDLFLTAPPHPPLPSSTITVNYSVLQNDWSGEDRIYLNNCMVADPCFVDPCRGDCHLKSEYGRWDPNSETWVTDSVTSPAIDAGDPNSDWTAELWPHGKRINMGRYGGTPQASMSSSNAGNIADLDWNGAVDYNDLDLFSGRWLFEQSLLPEDMDRNGTVDLLDYTLFADEWLWHE